MKVSEGELLRCQICIALSVILYSIIDHETSVNNITLNKTAACRRQKNTRKINEQEHIYQEEKNAHPDKLG